MPAHWSLDMAPVPESVRRSIRTSSDFRRKRLYPQASSAAMRSSRVVMRIGSTEWMRNGSMTVLNWVMSLGTGGRDGDGVGRDADGGDAEQEAGEGAVHGRDLRLWRRSLPREVPQNSSLMFAWCGCPH